MSKEIFKEAATHVNVPKELDISTLNGALRLAEEVFPGFTYAQNGLQFELRWSKEDPPFRLPSKNVPERIARKIVETPSIWTKKKAEKKPEPEPVVEEVEEVEESLPDEPAEEEAE